MATTAATYHSATCDRCKEPFTDENVGSSTLALRPTAAAIVEHAVASGWYVHEGELICISCRFPYVHRRQGGKP